MKAKTLNKIAEYLSRTLNLLTGGGFKHTLSARTGYQASLGTPWAIKFEVFVDSIPLFGKLHCYRVAVKEGLIKPESLGRNN